ncbi:MAG: transglycosylase domain-containing protein [Myxococcales bacterium]|nr:transglycosylase domain-containing protein [Myxococcales bacterium]
MSSEPAQRPERRPRRWRYVALGALTLVALAGAAIATIPRWAGPFVEDAIKEKVADRLGVDLEIGALDLDFDHVVIHDAVVRLSDQTAIRLTNIEVTLREGELWRGHVEVEHAAIRGGLVEGEVDELRDLAERARSRGLDGGGGGGGGRIRMRPERAEITGVAFDLRRSGTSASGEVDASVDLEANAVDLKLGDLVLRRGARELQVPRLTTHLVRGEGDEALRFPVDVEISQAAVPLTPEIAVADVHGKVSIVDQEATEIVLDVAGGFSDRPSSADAGRGGGDLWSLSGTVRRDLSAGEIHLGMEAFELSRVPEVLERLPLVDSAKATVGGKIDLQFADGKADVAGELKVDGLNVNHPMLAREVVRGVGFELSLEASADPSASTLELRKAALKRGGVTLEIEGEIVHPEVVAERRYRISAKVPPVACKDVLRAIPIELIPSLQGFVLAGEFEMNAEAKVDFADLEAVSLKGQVGIDKCVVKSAPPRVAASRLLNPFTHRAVMRDGREVVVELHPGSGDFTPFDEISPYMVAGVLTTEDGGFWRHKGFLPSQFEAALRRNLQAGRIRLGASTISMQMVKNVLLSHERTFARKLQELFLTWYVERSLPKQRIMEIYLNVIEFGPGIYGVTRAARHYFGKKPADLTPPEAAYLALMLPSPVKRHVHYCEGELNNKFKVKVRRILGLMHTRGRIDAETYETWKEGEITFDRREATSRSACLAEIQRLLEASEQQRSRSGLLDEGSTAEPDDTAAEIFDILSDDGEDPAAADAPGTPAMDDFMRAEEF